MNKQPPRHALRIFVTGHQRPDTDAAVSACVAARLKSRLDPAQAYEAMLLGEANVQTRWIFKQAGLPLPRVRRDIRPTVGEQMKRQFASIPEDANLAQAIELLHHAQGSLICVVAQNGVLTGVLSDRLPQSRYFYNFNAEDYLGHLIHLKDMVAAIGLKPLHAMRGIPPSPRGSFRVGGVPHAAAMKTWSATDVVLCGPDPAILAIAARKKVNAVVLADCTLKEARVFARRHPRLTMFYHKGSLMSLVSQLPMAISVSVIMQREFPRLSPEQVIDEVRDLVAHSPHALPVVDAAGKLTGTLSKADLLEARKPRVILVDHMERNQSVRGIEQAEIIEIIDHHRIGNIETMQPVRIDCRPVGSTASIIAAQFEEAGLKPSRAESVLLLGAVVSDTLLLTSPTTTPGDKQIARELAKLARVDLQEFGREVLRKNDELATAAPDKLVGKDIKEFQHGGLRFAAAQVETVDLNLLTETRRRELRESLDSARRKLGLAFALLMVTDVFKSESEVFVSDDDETRGAILIGSQNGPGKRFAGMVSRKKQLLPMVLQKLEALAPGK